MPPPKPESNLDLSSVRALVTEAVSGLDFRRATFGGAARGSASAPWMRIVLRPVDIRGGRHVQFEYFDATRCITKNFLNAEIAPHLDEVLDIVYAGIHIATSAEEIDIRTTKRGKVFIGRRRCVRDTDEAAGAHNRAKALPLPEGRADHFLETLGITTPDGRVRPTMRDKYTQINEFLKHLIHVVDSAGLLSLGRPVEILDCGCGASYLTLAAHHYLNEVQNIPARIAGVDANDELIRKSIAKADRLGVDGPAFACARISATDAKPDVVFALHACDTATDDAIALAVRAEAKLLLLVPCCHHNLNAAIRPEGPATVLRPLLRHGILHQRVADLATDAFRALALRIMGYRTDVVEFVSPEHTARNLMIRAVRGTPVGELTFIAEYRELCRFWGVRPYVEQALGEPFRQMVEEETPS